MDLYILRHGIAVEPETPGYKTDFERPLTADGEQKVHRIAKAMRNLELSFDLVLSSPYVRACETAEIIVKAFSLQKKLELRDSLSVEGNPRELIAELRARAPVPGSLLLVGHEPYLSTLTGLLLTGTAKPCVILKKGGLCKLAIDDLRIGRCAQLGWLLTPRQMLLMA
jgi:phosphohistidine phosphatase